MKLEAMLRDKEVMQNLSLLLEKHTVGGELDFENTELMLAGHKAIINGKLNIKLLKVTD